MENTQTRRNRSFKRRGAPRNDEREAHLAALGLQHEEEYANWCNCHGFAVAPHKTWREQNAELECARRLRGRVALQQHLEALGLSSVAEYETWCRALGLPAAIDKSVRQRRRETDLKLAHDRQEQRETDRRQRAARAQVTVTPNHIESLGLHTVEEYRTWCLEHGLGDALNKSAKKLGREVQLAELEGTKQQLRRPREVIARIAAGQVGANDLKAEYLVRIQSRFAELNGDATSREFLVRLLLHVEAHGDLLNTWTANPRMGEQPRNCYVEGLISLSRHGSDWMRPVEDWRAASRNKRRQFSSLARHLLARYDPPAFMDSAWFVADDCEARTQQNWFKHVGRGHNIRTADVPLGLSKRMAHCFLEAPDDLTIVEALRRGQIVGQGGDGDLVKAVVATRLGRSFEQEDFWGTVIRFFVRQEMLDPACIARIVDYLQARKYEHREVAHPDGSTHREEPPEPNLSMKSRSVIKLLRQVDAWYEHRTKEAALPAGQWQGVGAGGLAFSEEDESTGRTLRWTIDEIVTNRALLAEGKAMSHCVVSYARSCSRGATSIWSMQVKVNNRQRHVMTIAVDNKRGVITQARGRFNAHQDSELASQALARDRRGRSPNSRLNSGDRDLLIRSYRVLRFWAEREGLTYVESA